uniref:TNFR-Cys domain-containing protein n=1 Tax=Esox lucius TaxID=8010 RepID=A0AAY5KSR9_ESOLU
MLIILVMVYVTLCEGCVRNGSCCWCPPGFRVGEQATCEDSQCTPCKSDEYMTSYNRLSRCMLQPYCDPNVNFATPEHSPIRKTICRCKEGFYCSDEHVCLTCVSHSSCAEGFFLGFSGNHTHDARCDPIPDRLGFSNPFLLLCGIPIVAAIVVMLVIFTKKVRIEYPDVSSMIVFPKPSLRHTQEIYITPSVTE